MDKTTKLYAVDVPGLADAVARCAPSEKHTALLAAIRSFEGFEDAKLATFRDGITLYTRKVINAAGELVHDDHEVWLQAQADRHGGAIVRTYDDLKGAGYLLTECRLRRLFITVDNGGPAQNFFQLEVYLEEDYLDRAMFDASTWGVPRNTRELIQYAVDGQPLKTEQQTLYRPAAYRFIKAVNVPAFLAELEAAERVRIEKTRARAVQVIDHQTKATRITTFGELHPTLGRVAAPARRLFDDWERSSAGRSGARLCDSWVFTFNEYSDGKERAFSMIPQWTFTQKLAEVHSQQGSDYEFFGNLEKLDRRVKVPFAWYFFMLHGNRVHQGAAERALRAAEAGKVVTPEHDYRVLKDFQTDTYGF